MGLRFLCLGLRRPAAVPVIGVSLLCHEIFEVPFCDSLLLLLHLSVWMKIPLGNISLKDATKGRGAGLFPSELKESREKSGRMKRDILGNYREVARCCSGWSTMIPFQTAYRRITKSH
jgi:hypothetical protein